MADAPAVASVEASLRIAKYWQLRAGWQTPTGARTRALRTFSDSSPTALTEEHVTLNVVNSWEKQTERGRPAAARAAQAAQARRVAQAVAEREEGRRRLNTTTVAVSVASVLAAGAVAVVLPGTSHAAVTGTSSGSTSSGSSSSGSSSSGSSSTGSSDGSSSDSGSSSSSDQGGFQAPANSPQYSSGGGSVTSGGS